jgi:hypothetical protein
MIQPDGSTTDARVMEIKAPSGANPTAPALEACMERQFLSWKFPAVEDPKPTPIENFPFGPINVK